MTEYCEVWGKTGRPCNDPLCIVCTRKLNTGRTQPIGGVEEKGTKLDVGKLRFDLVPVRAMWEFVGVLTFGAKKYGANNWRNLIGWRWRYIGAGLRHVFSYMSGDRSDSESGSHHLSHALCCFFFVLDNELAIEAGVKTVPDGDAIPPEVK